MTATQYTGDNLLAILALVPDLIYFRVNVSPRGDHLVIRASDKVRNYRIIPLSPGDYLITNPGKDPYSVIESVWESYMKEAS